MTQLTTESRNPDTMHIDQLNGVGIAETINQADQGVAVAVATQTQAIGEAIEAIAARFAQGGRIIYMGAGTSGRLGALDAIELTPTYSVSPQRAFGLLAGGAEAMYTAVEGAEDSKTLAIEDLKAHALVPGDTVIAIAASGRTPYAIGALEYANEIGALTVSVTCNADNEMMHLAQIAISPVVGPEVITGSTRMKAGTAQKMVLNTISTGVMIKSGYVYENLMINVQPTNEKLVRRATGILMEVLDLDVAAAAELLQQAENNVQAAIVMAKKHVGRDEALALLAAHDNRVDAVI
ncbi:N-acetylmuramic acid 6-phosphate etherase [Lacticaseibacillus porcinae]|uniref:N-acetylmuramic acid 6-phosphate etherase n=1 Tax=Lacticaseibacillus porcinae TaxID=1123687 RepID=UPI000F7A4312|nr:N-acetylmuramic acid 6-phosphate etherase [Lacticaseibacillus porcinae]